MSLSDSYKKDSSIKKCVYWMWWLAPLWCFNFHKIVLMNPNLKEDLKSIEVWLLYYHYYILVEYEELQGDMSLKRRRRTSKWRVWQESPQDDMLINERLRYTAIASFVIALPSKSRKTTYLRGRSWWIPGSLPGRFLSVRVCGGGEGGWSGSERSHKPQNRKKFR